ncbi:MAG: hypothetical protein K6E16_09430 [Lachnospiraceae bacterium]|nr:hypothetical protein [Lachnospiraceae bacterium]
MLIITDVETLYRIPDNDLGKLTVKDRLVIFSRAGSQMPMSKFQALAAIKAKMEIVEYPEIVDTMGEADQMLYIGFLYGQYAASAKTGKQPETVRIYSSLYDKILKNSVKAPELLKTMGKIQIVGAEEKPKKAKPAVKKDKPASVSEKKPAEAASKADKSKPETVKKETVKTPAKTEKKISTPVANKIASMGLSAMKEKLIKNEEQLVKILKNATDAEIGYRFQLKMYFGETDAEKIWEKTVKSFDQLRKMV